MPRDPKDREGPFKWRVLTPSRTWEFTNDQEEDMKSWVRTIARIVNPELTFGMPLETIVTRSKKRGSPANVPLLVIILIQFLKDLDAANVEGVFRLSGDQNSVKLLKSRFNTEPHNTIVIPRETDVHVVTGTLKYFLRELEMSLIPYMSNSFLRAILALPNAKEKVVGFRKLIETLPVENAATLQFILKYLNQIAANASVNKMTTQNLAVVFGPCFIRSEPGTIAFQDADMQLNSVNTMIEQYTAIFPTDELIANVAEVVLPQASSGHGLSGIQHTLGAGSIGSALGGAPPASLPPSFLPPPPNRTPTAPTPASVTFRTAGPNQQPREPAIVIGSGAGAGAGPSSPGNGHFLSSPPTHLPPPPVTEDARPGSRPPAFAPPGKPNTSTDSIPNTPGTPTDGVTPSSSFVSIYDSSSSDEEVTDATANAQIIEESIVVTSLDDLEGEDGSIDVSKIFSKPLNSSTGSRNRTWTASKPTGSPSPKNEVSDSAFSSPAPLTDASSVDEITAWLLALGEDFKPYASVLSDEGFKTVQQLADITDEDMKELGVKMAHRKAMRAALDKI